MFLFAMWHKVFYMQQQKSHWIYTEIGHGETVLCFYHSCEIIKLIKLFSGTNLTEEVRGSEWH